MYTIKKWNQVPYLQQTHKIPPILLSFFLPKFFLITLLKRNPCGDELIIINIITWRHYTC
jgi:hypothetical protein